LGKSEPATHKNYITQYHKDNYEPERVRHVQFDSHDDPHMFHGLPDEYDDKMQKKTRGQTLIYALNLKVIKYS